MSIFSKITQMFNSGKKQQEQNSQGTPQVSGPLTLETILQEFKDCFDLDQYTIPTLQANLLFFSHQIDKPTYERLVLGPLQNIRKEELDDLLQQSQFIHASDAVQAVQGILQGAVALFVEQGVFLIDTYGPDKRNIEKSESESAITGPHDAFIETLETNISLIRRKIKSNRLKILKFRVGELTKTEVCVLYVDGLANMEYVDQMSERIKSIEFSSLYDGTILTQLIDDFPNALFPLFQTSERPDIAVSKLNEGKVVVIADQSPSVIIAPSSFFEFFTTPDDYYNRWAVGTALRLLRYMAFIITISFTSLYVSITTYHYEMIPENLLISLTESRSRVPFPPIIEALLMETTIEMLREAGARLPTKIGQTIGIVGGIVIGTAAVEAGFTSNILIISVAMSAIASFVIPSYTMSGSIRLIRFGLIILSGMLGNFGFVAGIALLIIHLSKLTSLGAPYTIPAAPLKPVDWKDIFIRGPFWSFHQRPTQARSSNQDPNKMKK
ncbi:GerA spore germination protein [Fontibacillus phaseoli]|uniref:GerA spore germination protein n=1 Tax=Fontibacillus phaseoli TaxID=1416533 RepID=A0A369BGB4_9BACL|nr:spore germination protein [Fontibacillus phaseoli]RCX20582.1 GerA spore germination protein [Fontibacillus phaseoli]